MALKSITLKTGTNPIQPTTIVKWPIFDFGDDINFTIQDSAGTAINLTGITPKMVLYEMIAGEKNQVFRKDATIVSAVAGTAKYTVLDGDFAKRTTYSILVELITGSTKRDSTQEVLFEVV